MKYVLIHLRKLNCALCLFTTDTWKIALSSANATEDQLNVAEAIRKHVFERVTDLNSAEAGNKLLATALAEIRRRGLEADVEPVYS